MNSAESIPKWIDFIREAGKKDIKIYVVGNKADLDNQISSETRKMAQELAEKQAQNYREVSAKTNSNIEDLFSKIVDELLSLHNKKQGNSNLSSSSVGESEKKTVNKGSEGSKTETIKLNPSDSKEGKKKAGNCC